MQPGDVRRTPSGGSLANNTRSTDNSRGVVIRDFTAAAESAKLREWAKKEGAAKKERNKKSRDEQDNQPWHSPRYNPRVQKGSPTKVVAKHPEKAKRNSPSKSLMENNDTWQTGLRSSKMSQMAIKQEESDDDEIEYETNHRDSLADREVMELQRCLKVQDEEISNLKLQTLELRGARDMTKNAIRDLEKLQTDYCALESKLFDTTKMLTGLEKQNAVLQAELESCGQPMRYEMMNSSDGQTEEVVPSSLLSSTKAKDAAGQISTLSITELKQSAQDARVTAEDLRLKNNHEEAAEVQGYADELEAAVKERVAMESAAESAPNEKQQRAKEILAMKELERKLMQREYDCEALDGHVAQLQAELEESKKELQDSVSAADLQAAETESAHLRTQLEECRIEISQLRDSVPASQQPSQGTIALVDNDSEVAALQAKVAQLQQEKAQANQDLMQELNLKETEAIEASKLIEQLKDEVSQLKAQNTADAGTDL